MPDQAGRFGMVQAGDQVHHGSVLARGTCYEHAGASGTVASVGAAGLVPERFRLGASTLLDDLCAQRRFHTTNRYWGPEYFPLG